MSANEAIFKKLLEIEMQSPTAEQAERRVRSILPRVMWQEAWKNASNHLEAKASYKQLCREVEKKYGYKIR